MLALEVALLTGRYVATAFDDRARAEWPPHPARLFSALVATHFEAAHPSEEERAVLEWIEGLGPPEISASEASEREVCTVFVPVNDVSVVPSIDDQANALAVALGDVDAASSKDAKERSAAEKKVVAARKRFTDAVQKAISALPMGKEGKEGPPRAASLLPEHRGKQPRTFPSVTPADPRIVFAWPQAELSPARRVTIDGLASRVVRLGHSSSLVAMRLREERTAPTWIPDETGEVRAARDETVLRVVDPGQMEALDRMYEQQADDPGRVMPSSFHRYVRPSTSPEARVPTTAFGRDWIVLRRVDGPRLPSLRAVDVARSVRKALLKGYGDGAPEILSGHRAPGEPSGRAHLAIVPLPFVGHERADGSILGVALVLPSDATNEERRAVYRALDTWQRAERKHDAETARLPVYLGKAGTLYLTILEDDAAQSTLRPKSWSDRATTWSSATPIVLDRNPGDLRSSDPKKEGLAYAAAEETIALACTHIGLPRPKRVTAMPSAPLAGADKARQFPPYLAGKPPMQRVLIHATIVFEAPVEGPLLIGAGRYFGLGLFRPIGGS